MGAGTTDERCRDARHGRPEGSADTRRRNQRSVVPIPKGEVIVKFRNLVPVSAHVTLNAVQIKKGEFISVCLLGTKGSVSVELHVDTDGTPRVVVAEHNLKIVKTFEEIYEDR